MNGPLTRTRLFPVADGIAKCAKWCSEGVEVRKRKREELQVASCARAEETLATPRDLVTACGRSLREASTFICNLHSRLGVKTARGT